METGSEIPCCGPSRNLPETEIMLGSIDDLGNDSPELFYAGPPECENHVSATKALAYVGSWCESVTPPRDLWEDDDLLVSNGPTVTSRVHRRQYREPYVSRIPDISEPDRECEDDDLFTPKMPKTRPISQEQLVAEVKGIYAGLVMVESKCIEVDYAQRPQYEAKLTENEWQASIALHRTLMHEPHDFFPASQHLLASPTPPKLASKYAMPARMWRDRIHRYLGFKGRRPSSLLEQLLDFVHLAETLSLILDKANHLLENLQGELLEWLEKTEKLFDRLLKRFGRSYHQLLIYAFIFFYFFSEFPNGLRHLCTTMPWTIWPALVVLWGVCWMFPPGSNINELADLEGISTLDQHQQEQSVNVQDSYFDSDLLSHPFLDDESWWTALELPNPSLEDVILQQASSGLADELFLAFPPYAESLPQLTSPTAVSSSSSKHNSLPYQHAPLPSFHSPSSLQPCDSFQPNPTTTRESTGEVALNQELTVISAQRTSLICPGCRKAFSRPDALKRHVREQKHCQQSQTSDGPEEFLCPHSGCRKSRKGFGFKRHQKLQQHLKTSCKVQLRRAIENNISTEPSTASQPPQSKSKSADNPSHRVNRAEQEGGITDGSDVELNKQDRITLLEKYYRIEMEDLQRKEVEVKSLRESLQTLQGLIKLCQQEKK